MTVKSPWDKPGVAKQVDAYWRGSADEMEYRAKLAALVHEVMERDDWTVLDVGCGTGLMYDALRAELGDLHPYYGAIDSSSHMLAIARKRSRSPESFRRGDAENIPYPDREFDIAVAFEVFGHMPDCSKALGELLRVGKHAALFTLWVKDGLEAPLEGREFYEYPVGWAEAAVARIMGDRPFTMERRAMPWTQAYIVRMSKP